MAQNGGRQIQCKKESLKVSFLRMCERTVHAYMQLTKGHLYQNAASLKSIFRLTHPKLCKHVRFDMIFCKQIYLQCYFNYIET